MSAWYNEQIRGNGFIINPYDRWKNTKFRHIFAFDADANFYIGQFSVYLKHLPEMFPEADFFERGFVLPQKKELIVKYSREYSHRFGLKEDFNLRHKKDLILINNFATNIPARFNERLKRIGQRMYDYGMPEDSILLSNEVDLMNPSLKLICKEFKKKPENLPHAN